MEPISPPIGNHQLLLRLESVCREYSIGEVTVRALHQVSLDVRRGELLVVVGPSGSGKTTLLNLIGGLDRPNSGHIWFRGQDLAQLRPAELSRYRRETVGFVFQFFNLVPHLTAAENVLLAAELTGGAVDIHSILERVGLSDRGDHFPSQLSGGEQQRVAIARAIAKDPEILLCDEPTGALDYISGKNVLRLLVDLKSGWGKTVVLITHNTAIAAIADRVARLRSGELIEIYSNPQPAPPEEIVW